MNPIKACILLLLGSPFCPPVFAQEAKVHPEATTGKIYFIRSTGFKGSIMPFTTFIDGNLVCKLNNKRYSVHEAPPGEHKITVQFAGKMAKQKAEPVTVNLEAGKTYYIQLVYQTGMLVDNLYCQEVTENSARAILPGLAEDTECR